MFWFLGYLLMTVGCYLFIEAELKKQGEEYVWHLKLGAALFWPIILIALVFGRLANKKMIIPSASSSFWRRYFYLSFVKIVVAMVHGMWDNKSSKAKQEETTMIKRYIEIRPLQREALFMEETYKIKIRKAKNKTSENEYVIYSECDLKSTVDQINNIVDLFNINQ